MRPAAARMTTARFIRFGPAAEASAQPGGAELEHPGHRVGQLGGGRLVTRLGGGGEALELGAGHGIRVVAGPGPRGGEEVGERCGGGIRHGAPQIRPTTAARRRPQRSAASRPASSTSSWSSGVVRDPGGGVGDERDAEHLEAALPGRDRLERGRHADEVAADDAWPSAPPPASRSAARGTARRPPRRGRGSTSLRDRAQARRVDVGEVDEVRALDRRGRGEVDVVGDEHGRAGRPLLAQAAAAVGDDDRAAPGRGGGADAVHDRAARRAPRSSGCACRRRGLGGRCRRWRPSA